MPHRLIELEGRDRNFFNLNADPVSYEAVLAEIDLFLDEDGLLKRDPGHEGPHVISRRESDYWFLFPEEEGNGTFSCGISDFRENCKMIRSLRFLLLLVSFGTLSSGWGQAPVEYKAEAPVAGAVLPGWTLTFSDEFEGDRLDYTKWTPKDPWGVVRNDELQAYIVKAFHLSGGILKIRCEDIPAFYDGAKRDYRSGMMTTSGKFSQTYGRFEMRCKVPKGKGLWPAFWLLPEPPAWPPEIDILEILCHETDKLYMSNHWPDPAKPDGDSQSQTGEFKGVDFADGFHTVAVEWEPGEIRWFVDGVQRHRSDQSVPVGPMFILVNLAVGGAWAGEPDDGTPFPLDFEVDYVRVWEKSK